jgi:hypothetical protein
MAARKPWPEEAAIKEAVYNYVRLNGPSKAAEVIKFVGKGFSLTPAQKAAETPRKNGQKPLKTWNVLCHKARRQLLIDGVFSHDSKVGVWELSPAFQGNVAWLKENMEEAALKAILPHPKPVPGGVLADNGALISNAELVEQAKVKVADSRAEYDALMDKYAAVDPSFTMAELVLGSQETLAQAGALAKSAALIREEAWFRLKNAVRRYAEETGIPLEWISLKIDTHEYFV